MLAQLTAIKSLLLRHAQLDRDVATAALQQASLRIQQELAGGGARADAGNAEADPAPVVAGQPFQPRPDPLVAADLTPWLLRRLALACAMARELRLAADRVKV